MDAEWLKNLASATGRGPDLRAGDPKAVERLAAARLDAAIHDLYAEAQDCALVFNEHARGGRQLDHLPLPARNGGGQGFMLLMGRVQIVLERKSDGLEASLVQLDGFMRRQTLLHRFSPHIDPFGSLVWAMDNALLMSNELIIKRLLEDLARAAPA